MVIDGLRHTVRHRVLSRSLSEGLMTGKRWLLVVGLGVAVICVFFFAGSYSGLYLAGDLQDLAMVPSQHNETTAEFLSPTAVEERLPAGTATRAPSLSSTSRPEPPSPTSASAIPLITPSARPAPTPQESFVVDEWEPDDSQTEASLVQIGETQRHNLHLAGDRDWLCFQAEAGRAYVLETSGLGSEMDTVIHLYDELGTELALDDDGADEFLASQLWWVAREDGALYAMVRGFADTEEGPEADYDVSLRSGGGFDIDQYEPDDSPAEASRILIGDTQSHNWHVSSDEDWISFEVQQGITVVVQTLNLGVDADTVIYLYDRQGNELAFDDDGGDEAWASRLEWMASGSGILYVKVVGWMQSSSGPETRYELALSASQVGDSRNEP
jgi:hypothetical protein